jgi:hypothetical protein
VYSHNRHKTVARCADQSDLDLTISVQRNTGSRFKLLYFLLNMKKIIVAISLFLIISSANAIDWWIEGDGVVLHISQDFVPFETSTINNLILTDNGVTIFSEYSDGKATPPHCYMVRANKEDKVLYCQEKSNWRLNNAIFYSTKQDVWNCVKNCNKNTPRTLKVVYAEGD